MSSATAEDPSAHSPECPLRRGWTIVKRDRRDLAPHFWQITAHEGKSQALQWYRVQLAIESAQKEVKAAEDKELQKATEKAEKIKAHRAALEAGNEAKQVAIENSPVKKELRRVKRLKSAASDAQEPEASDHTGDECDECDNGTLKHRTVSGWVWYGCSNWKKDGSGCNRFKKSSKKA